MIDDRNHDLAQLTLAAARALVGRDFVRPHEGGPGIVLRLVAAEPARRDPTAADELTGRPFSLLFRGPGDPRLSQGMHVLEHPDHPLRGIFLVPVGRDDAGCTYEAVFA